MPEPFETLPPKVRAAGHYLILCHHIELGAKSSGYSPTELGARALSEQENRVKVAALQVFYQFFTGEDKGGADGGEGGGGGEDAGDGSGGGGSLQSGGDAAAARAEEKPKARIRGSSC